MKYLRKQQQNIFFYKNTREEEKPYYQAITTKVKEKARNVFFKRENDISTTITKRNIKIIKQNQEAFFSEVRKYPSFQLTWL